MGGVLTDSGYGFGDGDGDGYGYGYGSGSGDGDGDGDGYGYGYGSGSGDGYGDGDGDGDGYGYGYGDGSGSGSGSGETIWIVGGYDVELIRPFSVIKVGCQVHTIAAWRQRWRKIAKQEGVQVTEEEVARIEAIMEVSDE